MNNTILKGTCVENNVPPNVGLLKGPSVRLTGSCRGSSSQFVMDAGMLSKHTMLLGSTGCGKTQLFKVFVDQLKRNMSSNDVMIIFDTKRDYIDSFYDPSKDFVISASDSFSGYNLKTWNIFRELTVNGYTDKSIVEDANEISWSIFSDSIENNNSNPFFPNAARDAFAAILIGLCRMTNNDPEYIRKLSNKMIRNSLDRMSASWLHSILEPYPDLKAVLSYVGDGNNDQGLGVIAELENTARALFTGLFAEKGDFSMRDFIKSPKGNTLFIEYDLTRGSTLTPIYRLLIDLALKEAMAPERNKSHGNVFIFCDEFKLIPNLRHLTDAVNFGRSLGVKIFAGLQSINQIYENYGEYRGQNIVAGFSTLISFMLNDESSRSFVTGKYGKNYQMEITEREREKRIGNVVEDWLITTLKVGEAVVGLPGKDPFIFYFNPFEA